MIRDPNPNPSAAAILWTAGGIRPAPVLGILARELEAEAAGYRIGHQPDAARARELRSAARRARELRQTLEELEVSA